MTKYVLNFAIISLSSTKSNNLLKKSSFLLWNLALAIFMTNNTYVVGVI